MHSEAGTVAQLWSVNKDLTMNMRWWVALSALSVAMVSVPARAGEVTVTHKVAGLEFDIPEDWKPEVSEEVEGLLTVTAPDNVIVLQCWVLEAEDLDAALDGLAEGLEESLDEVELAEDVEELEVNGLPRVVLNGTAEKEGHPLVLAVAVIGAEKPVIFLGMGSPEAVEAHQELLKTISALSLIHI